MSIDLDPFVRIVGAEHVRAGRASDHVRGVAAQVVVAPGNAAELAGVLRSASSDGLAVLPCGGGTKREWGNPPARADVILSTARLNRIVDHAWADLTVIVEAGCTIKALQESLQTHGQRVAVDPLWPDRATVGGVLSTNDTGALRLRFGGLRDLIIGVTLALADGTLATSGGRVVKNVAGYDLPKLATGALGTLGVITSAIFRLHPSPQQARTLSVPIATVDQLQRLMESLQDSTLTHTALQARLSSSRTGASNRDDGLAALDVLLEGTAAGIAAQSLQAQALVGDVAIVENMADAWDARQMLWSMDGSGVIVKVSVLLTEVANLIRAVQRLAKAGQLEWRAVVHATGLGWIRLDGAPAHLRAAVDELRSAVEASGGSLAILRSAGVADSCDAWGRVGDARDLMAAVRHQFDPGRTLNPGRFVNGT